MSKTSSTLPTLKLVKEVQKSTSVAQYKIGFYTNLPDPTGDVNESNLDSEALKLDKVEAEYLSLVSETQKMLQDVSVGEYKKHCQACFPDCPLDDTDSVQEMIAKIDLCDNLFTHTFLECTIKAFLKHTPLPGRLESLDKHLEELKGLITLQQLIEKDAVPGERKEAFKVILHLTKEWLSKTVKDLEKLVREIFKGGASTSFFNVCVAAGPLVSVYFSPQNIDTKSWLQLANEKETTDFMSQVGVSGVQFGEEVVTIKRKGGAFSFEKSLIKAVENNDKRVLSFVLELNTSPDVMDQDDWSALMTGSFLGHTAVVDLLLRAGANPDLHSSDEEPPLIIACKNDRSEIASLLLKAGANPNVQDKDGLSALFVAVSRRNTEIANMLLSNASVNPNLKDDFGETALHMASQTGNSEAVILLLEANADLNLKSYSGVTPLFEASESGYPEVVRILLESYADPDSQMDGGVTALIIASQKGYAQVVSLLLKANANPNHQSDIGVTAIYMASQNGHVEVVTILLEANASVDLQRKNGTTALYMASESGHFKIVDILLKKNAKPNIQGTDGSTALSWQARMVTRILLVVY